MEEGAVRKGEPDEVFKLFLPGHCDSAVDHVISRCYCPLLQCTYVEPQLLEEGLHPLARISVIGILHFHEKPILIGTVSQFPGDICTYGAHGACAERQGVSFLLR